MNNDKKTVWHILSTHYKALEHCHGKMFKKTFNQI